AAVAKRVSEKLIEHKNFKARVENAMRDLKAGSVPRSLAQDAKELALIAAREERAAVDAIVRRKVNAWRAAHPEAGEAFTTPPGSAPTAAERAAYFAAENTKDAIDADDPHFETRDAF